MKYWKEKDKKTNRYIWRACEWINKKYYRIKGSSKEEVLNTLDHLRIRARADKYSLPKDDLPITLREVANKYLKRLSNSANDKNATTIINTFQSRFSIHFDIRDLTTAHLANYASDLGKVSPATINKYLGHISKMLRLAHQLFPELSDYHAPKIPWAKSRKKNVQRLISEGEIELLLTELRKPKLRAEKPDTHRARLNSADWFEINLHTGMRGGETKQLRWSWIDWTSAEIRLPKEITKTREARAVPMNSRVVEILKSRLNSSTFVFPHPKQNTYLKDQLALTLLRVANNIGLTHITPHMTRHTATSNMLRLSGDISAVQEILGHSDRTMTLHYSHASFDSKRRAVEALVGGETSKK